mmetsp:Transcript_15935/g.60727  ORF Transcript_15935/g.60727 Transcript_15935/m.60727 type:complete len:332 (+) Transcript_15935:65-1060(+)
MELGDILGGYGGFRMNGHLGMGNPNAEFREQYHCFSMAVIGRSHLEQGDKMLLPPSALDTLARLNVEWPMLFNVTNEASGKSTHCGVLEFSAEEGKCHLPYWVMQNLLASEGSLISIRNVSLPKATFVKFQPQHVDFLDISDPRAVLEYTLRSYSCLTLGDHICVPYNDKNYYLEVKELQPAEAASIIETDCNVDFEAPVGYQEPASQNGNGSSGMGAAGLPIPAPQTARAAPPEAEEEKPDFEAFEGSGQRLDGKPSPVKPSAKHDGDQKDEAKGAPAPAPAPSGQSGGSAAVAPRKPRYMGRGRGGGASKWASRKPTTQAFAGQGRTLK